MVKVNWNLNYDEMETAHVLDVEFNVRKRIPYEKKLEFAQEYTERVAMLGEDGSAILNPYADVTYVYLAIKYYTDIELNEGDNLGWIYDFVIAHDMMDTIADIAGEDLRNCRMFADRMADCVLLEWEQTHSLAGTLARLTSDEELKKLAHAAPLNEELIDLLHMRNDMQSGNVVAMQPLVEFAKKNK